MIPAISGARPAVSVPVTSSVRRSGTVSSFRKEGRGAALIANASLNKTQALGSHNSYHLKPSEDITDSLQGLIDSGILPSNNADLQELFLSVRYEHPPIDTQLEQHNVRAIELDAWPDEQGGKFRCNAVRRFFRLGNYVDSLPEMSQPGFKVFHQDGIDQESSCKTLVGCLQILKQWSQNNPNHYPIFLRLDGKHKTTIEFIEQESSTAAGLLRFVLNFAPGLFQCGRRWPTVDSPLSANTVREMVETFSSVLGAENIVKPDDLRGSYESLQAALQDKGADNFWPDVDSVRGKFFIIGGGINSQLREAYGPKLAGSPAFTRILVSTNTRTPTPAPDQVFVEHDPKPIGQAFKALKNQGLFTVARVDTTLILDQAPDLYNGAVAAGANLIVSDFIVPQEFDNSNYTVKLPCDDAEFCPIP